MFAALSFVASSTLAQAAFAENPITVTVNDPVDTFSMDLDGDGDDDVVALSRVDGATLVLENQGGGSFAPRAGLVDPLNGLAHGVPLDVDGDGDDDLVLVTVGGSLLLHVNTGLGTTWPRTIVGSGVFDVDYAFATGDLDGDGGEDLFVQDGADVGWYRSGGGTLSGYQVIDTGVARGLALVDVDDDGVLDVVSDATGPTVRWLVNDGLGNFTPGAHTHGLAAGTVADLDGDGVADVVSMMQSDVSALTAWSVHTVEWERGLGSGAFAPRAPLSVYFGSTCSIAGVFATDATLWVQPDRNGDGVPEMLLRARCGNAAVENLAGLSTGPTSWLVDGTWAAPVRRHGDVDGDGRADWLLNDSAISWRRQLSGGSFAAPASLVLAAGGSRPAVGDLDRDGSLDVVAEPTAGVGQLVAYAGLGGGAFDIGRIEGTQPGSRPTLADLDRDGDLDAITYVDSERFVWSEGDGAGGFGPTHVLGPGTGTVEFGEVAVGDFDGDGHLDVVHTSRSNGALRLWRGTGAAGAAAFSSASWTSSGAWFRLAVGDLEGDGDLDVVTYWSFSSSDPVTVHLNQGQGTFAPGVTITTPWARRIALADADRDGDLDIYTCGLDAYFFIEQDPPGSFRPPIARPLTPGRRYSDLDLGDLDGDGFVDLVLVGNATQGGGSPGVDVLLGGPQGFATSTHWPTLLPAEHLALRDVDGDVDLDVLLASSSGVAWLENPLGGVPSAGATYCSGAAPNSTGAPGRVDAVGSASLGRRSLRLVARELPQGSAGYFLASTTRGFLQGVNQSQGNLCLGGAIGRFVGPGQVGNAGASGGFDLQVDLAAMPTPLGPTLALSGSTWNFQAWYRDANPSPTSNFTDATSVTFEP